MANMDHGEELSSIDFKSMIGGPLCAVIEAQAEAALMTTTYIKEVGFKSGDELQDTDDSGTGEPVYVSFKYPKEVAPYQPAIIGGYVKEITVTNGGSGYTSKPTVTIASSDTGTTATAEAEIVDGAVTKIIVTNGGSGYSESPSTAPSVTFTGGGGTGASADASVQATIPAVPAEYQEMKLEVPILTMLPIPYIKVDEVTIDFNAKINSVEYKQVDTRMGYAREKTRGSSLKFKWFGASSNLKAKFSFQRSSSKGHKVSRTYSLAVHLKAVQDDLPGGMEHILGILENAIRSQPANLTP